MKVIQREKISKRFLNVYNTIILLSFVISTIIVIFLYKVSLDKRESFYQEHLTLLDIAYQTSIDKYSFFITHIVNDDLLIQNNLKYFYKATHAKSEEERRYNKGLFFRNLYPVFEHLKSYGLRQFHFYLPDNTSFLRFHHPSKYGDDLTNIRQTVALVNEKQTPISAFETGRVISGFRNVFPLVYKQEVVGAFEISASIKSILDSLNKRFNNKEFTILFDKKSVEAKLFESQKYLYTPSTINPNFLVEDSTSILENSPKAISSLQKRLNTILALDKALAKKLNAKKSASSLIELEDANYLVSFLPIFGLENHFEGYLLSYANVKNIPEIIVSFKYIVSFIIYCFIIFCMYILVLKAKSNELISQKNWFIDINDALGEGLYVIDENANILYANPHACEILGYTEDELIGKSAHYTFHSHEGNKHLPIQKCPILTGIQEHGMIECVGESFRTKDGRTIPVELNAKAIFKNGKIHQSVTVFRDISVKKALESRMKLLTKALEASSNTIVITDIDGHIEWTNPSFERLTGFRITDVLGKKPNELLKSGKQSQGFYKNMWETILDKRPWHGEIINKRQDGSFYYEDLTITPVLNSKREIQNFIAVKQDISNRKEKEKNIEYLAYHDHLTNLPNRRLFSEHLNQLIKSLKRESKYVAVLFLDLDKFKLLNDEKGHDCGDELLREIALRLTKSIREKDIVARLGGDEFVMIIDDLCPEREIAIKNVITTANKILQTIRIPMSFGNFEYIPTTSIGIYLFNESSEEVEDILKKADIALYEAKGKGRDTYFVYSE